MSKPETPCRWGCLPVGYRCSHYLDLPAPQAEAQPSDTPCALCGGPSGFAFDPPRPVLCVACRVKTTAEAPPANVSEPPDFESAAAVATQTILTTHPAGHSAQNLARAYLALKAQIAALQEAHDHAQDGLKSARKQEGEMRTTIAALEARIKAMKAEPNRQTILRQAAELERLRDLIVQAREWRFSEADTAWSLVIEARAIHAARAAREAKK